MEDKIEIGEYVRTKKGQIDKVVNIIYDIPESENYYVCEKINIYRKDIVKHFKNIVDLIEVGDYVNGYKVIMDLEQSMKHYSTVDRFVTAKGYTFEEGEIKSIVTKEQFSKMEYKVGE